MKALHTAAVLALVAAPASAATLTATSLNADVSDFSIEFDDTSGDGLLQYAEINSFSWMTDTGVGVTFTSVLGVPEIPGVSTGVVFWTFVTGAVELAYEPDSWTYEITGLSEVPLPASAPLILGGLALLGWAGRRRS